ncbi:MAG: response regulator [Proteobacteria bacterium]|nr:response regulator [Pseudomonadota bacterium]
MENETRVELRIEIAGFSQREHMLLLSVLKVSELRRFVYREWRKEGGDLPNCLLIDIDNPENRMRCDLEALRPGRYPIVAVGAALPDKPAFAAHVKRPVRWAEILHTIDVALKIPVDAPTTDARQAEKLSTVSNELEVGQIDNWYDRSKPVEFQSDPAVLVVDPDPAAGDYVSSKLAGTGYRVDRAQNMADAIVLLDQHRYNCVIHELDLPDQPGLELCALLKQKQDRRRTASVILTARQEPLDRVRAMSAGCDAYLNKPIQPILLLRTLEKFLPDWRTR